MIFINSVLISSIFLLSACSTNETNLDNCSYNCNCSCMVNPFYTYSIPNKEIDDYSLINNPLCDILTKLGQPAHYLKMGSAVKTEYIKHLLIYPLYDDDLTALYIWIKGEKVHKTKRDEFNGFHFQNMLDSDFWE